MKCECGGILLVVRVEKPPETLPQHKRILYDRLCDVECQKCGKVLYSKPYDSGRPINPVRDIQE